MAFTEPMPIAFNINFDSLGEAFGFPAGFRDPSFFQVFDRFAEFAERYGFRYSIFVIGKDLENPEVAARVREWSQAGHEIGNHTWSHPMSLGAMRREAIEQEILRCHEAVIRVTGKEPKGFIAPAWSTSEAVSDTLFQNGYEYDTSYFLSWWLYPVVGKIAVNHWKDAPRLKKVLSRRDWLYPMTKSIRPGVIRESGERRLLEIPLPVQNRFSLPFWHTVGFIFGWEKAERTLRELLASGEPFYYLLHPSDLVSGDDLSSEFSHSLERLDVPIGEKLDAMERMLGICADSGRKMVTLRELAATIVARGV